MQPIKILVDARWFDSFYSGVTTYIKGIYKGFENDPNFSITIIGKNTEQLKSQFPHSFQFMELHSKSNFKRLYFDIPRIIQQHKFDYAHFQYICPLSKKGKYIVTLHDLLFLDYKKAFPLKFTLQNTLLFFLSAKRADILLTVSNYSKKRIAHHFNINTAKIHVTPNGVLDIFNHKQNFSEITTKYDIDKYLLFVSRIEPRKNHIALIKAFIELQLYKDYSLIFIGKKTISVNELDVYLESLPADVKQKVLFIENTTEEELHSFYANASLFVYPSLYEGFGIPPIEAICSGAKTICANETALEDFDFLEKYQFNPHNVGQLKEMIVKTLNDDNYPFAEFKKTINERYSWLTIADILKSILKDDFIARK